jgi:hypothetical protein
LEVIWPALLSGEEIQPWEELFLEFSENLAKINCNYLGSMLNITANGNAIAQINLDKRIRIGRDR